MLVTNFRMIGAAAAAIDALAKSVIVSRVREIASFASRMASDEILTVFDFFGSSVCFRLTDGQLRQRCKKVNRFFWKSVATPENQCFLPLVKRFIPSFAILLMGVVVWIAVKRRVETEFVNKPMKTTNAIAGEIRGGVK